MFWDVYQTNLFFFLKSSGLLQGVELEEWKETMDRRVAITTESLPITNIARCFSKEMGK